MKKKLLSSLIIVAPIPLIFTMSCSCDEQKKTDSNQSESNKSFQNRVNEYFDNKQLSFNFKNPTITRKIFDKEKNNLSSIKKAFELKLESQIKEEKLNFNVLGITEQVDNELKVRIEIFNFKHEKAEKTIDLFFSPSQEQKYVNNVYNEIKDKIFLKEKYQDVKINEIVKNVKTEDEFLNKYIDNNFLVNFLGIKVKLKIPSQSINFKSSFKINVLLYNEDNNYLKPENARQPYLKINKNQIIPITILKQSDLESNESINQDNEYFGETFFMKDKDDNKLIINNNFNGKNIISDLNFSNFNEIEFKENANFNDNKISNIEFNLETKIINLKSGLFQHNSINKIILPKRVNKFNIGAFDAKVIIKGIESIELIQQFFDPETKDLYLNRLKNENEFQNLLKIINKVEMIGLLSFNKVYLPNFDFEIDSQIICNEIIFNEEREKDNYEFNSKLSNWTVKKNINISEKIIKININNLPAKSNVNRKLNSKVIDLIKDKKLNLSDQLVSNNDKTYKLFENVNELNDFFWSENLLNIDEVILKENASTSVLDMSKISDVNFFVNNKIKKIVIPSNIIRINKETHFYNIQKKLKDNNIELIREKNSEFTFISNKKINIKEFYEYLKNQITNDINQLIVGYEYLIETVELNGVTEIRNSLFNNLQFLNRVNINLSAVTSIKDFAFYNTSNLVFNTTNFHPIEIGISAFENSGLSGNITLNKTIKLGSRAFYNCKLTDTIDLSNISETKIEESTFYNNEITNVILSSKIIEIKSWAFYNNKLTSIDLSHIQKIQDNAFNSTGLIGELNLTNVSTLGSRAFSDTKITSVKLSETLNSISDYAFYNSDLTSIDFKNVKKIGEFAFHGNNKLKQIDIENLDSIGKSAFSHVVSVNGFKFNKFNIDIFDNFDTETINFTDSSNNISNLVGYDENKKKLDLSEKIFDVELKNYLKIFFKKTKLFNELILFNKSTIAPDFIEMLKKLTIKKLTWNSGNKNMNFNLRGIKINELDENFLVGASNILSRAFENCNINMDQLSLMNVQSIGDYAFAGNNIKKFTNTERVNKIGSLSFSSNVEFNIHENVKLKANSFGNDWKLSNKITRNNIFSSSSQFIKIYNQNTKILDFSKIEINKPWSREELNKYLNINQYLLDGDVKKIILPRTYIVFENLINELGTVEEIEFQEENQQIWLNAFKGTTIKNKPEKSSTNIVYDESNFFDF